MFDKLEDLLIRFEEIMGELHEPTVTNNQERFRKLMKEQSDLTPIVDAYTEYKKCKQDIEDSLSMLEEEKDEEMREMIKETLNDSKKRVEELEQELKILLLPKDPNDDKNVIVEIRAGAGGDEAALFAAEIYRMYVHYAEKQRWKVELINVDEIGIGGMKEVQFTISGQGAYSKMKYESGVHRVQRVPETESGGRIHTSTISVAVMPEVDDDIDIVIEDKDPNDDKNVIVEIRAGAGGDEAALFAAEIYRMYVHYAEKQRWKVELINVDEIGIGGMKEVQFTISGQGAYSKMKYESGVHRVQRVPETESGGRIHTSTISVAVMPEVDDDIDIVIEDKDIRIDVMRASGNGGQCVNTTDSAVRLTHYPSGIVVYSQTEKSQIQNKAKAFALLKSKLYDIEQQQRHDAEAEMRRSQIGTGDRSEKIRTYNFPQGRVTDHRIGLTLYKLDKIMNGDIEEIIDACIAADQAAKLAKMNEE